MANKPVLIGKVGKLYYGAPGAKATTLTGNIKDAKISMTSEEEDVSDRDSDGWGETVPVSKTAEITFQMNNIDGDPFVGVLTNAFMNDTAVAILALDKENGRGLDADCMVSRFELDQKLKGAQIYDVTLKPMKTGRAPHWTNNG